MGSISQYFVKASNFPASSITAESKKRSGGDLTLLPAKKLSVLPKIPLVSTIATGIVKKPRKPRQIVVSSNDPSYLHLYRSVQQLEEAGIPLTTEEETRTVVANYHAFSNRAPPPMFGMIENPKPIAKTLVGFVFIITGVMESMERAEVVDFIKACGGQVSTTVAKKTTHAIVGTDCGKSKLDEINKMELAKLNQAGLVALVRLIAVNHLPSNKMESPPNIKNDASDDEFVIDSD